MIERSSAARTETTLDGALQLLRSDDLDAANQAFRSVLSRDPDNFLARLFLGLTLDRQGDGYGALSHYFGAITCAQSRGHWRDPAAILPGLRQPVQRAIEAVISGRRELFDRVLAPLRARHGPHALQRVDKALAIYLLDEPPGYTDPRQRPSFLFFPDLPAFPYYGRERFPWLAELESQTVTIRQELLELAHSRANFEPFHKTLATDSYLKGSRGPAAWDTFFFYRDGIRNQENCSRCPSTAAALEAVPMAHIRNHAPECLFSVLQPGTHILPHRGVTNTRLVVHLPLVVPEDCALVVGGQKHEWHEGRGVVFDDTFEHEAWNRSDRPRGVLLLDVWNPDLTGAEREAVSDLVGAIGDFNDDCGINLPRA